MQQIISQEDGNDNTEKERQKYGAKMPLLSPEVQNPFKRVFRGLDFDLRAS